MRYLVPTAGSAAEAWDFDPQPDPYDDTAVLDLSYLNEEVAGENGFIALGEDGESFVDGAGKPIRFGQLAVVPIVRDETENRAAPGAY